MKIRPLRDHILVRRLEAAETVRGGIIIPDTAKEKPQVGEVIAVGTGKLLENGTIVPLDVKVGDTVLFGKYAGGEVPKTFGDDHLIIAEHEVMGVVEGMSAPAKK